MLIDSNIIIYASKLTYPALLSYLKNNEVKLQTSAIRKVEVLGYHQLKKIEKRYLENFFNAIRLLPIDTDVISKAIELKQERNIATADAIVAATALVHNLPILTQNKKDFNKIESLEVYTIADLV